MKWRTTIRDSGLLEYICEHGVGHPDPDSATRLGKITNNKDSYHIHGCDGCCSKYTFPPEKKDILE